MDKPRARYSRLAPLAVEEQVRLALVAIYFFGYRDHQEKCKILGRDPSPTGGIRPFSGSDFATFLERTGQLHEAQRYMYRLRELLQSLERADLLVAAGQTRDVFLGKQYYFIKEFTQVEQRGHAWLSSPLGPEFVFHYFAPGIVQITGCRENGDLFAGTGLVVASRWILTCAHVINGMSIDLVQEFAGQKARVVRQMAHQSIDVGLLEVDSDLPVTRGLAFRQPTVAETVFILGYPRVPMTRRAALIMQRGEVTSRTEMLIHGQPVFLFSAIARPGNSGGPIVAASGHVVGIVTQQLEAEDWTFNVAPFHAGVDSLAIVQAIGELDAGISVPLETYS